MYYNLFSTIQIYYNYKKKQNNVTILHLFYPYYLLTLKYL